MKTVQALHKGRMVIATPTGLNEHDDPHTGAGYRQATVQKKGKPVMGFLHWLGGQWRWSPRRKYAHKKHG